jgi:hypothetical protein
MPVFYSDITDVFYARPQYKYRHRLRRTALDMPFSIFFASTLNVSYAFNTDTGTGSVVRPFLCRTDDFTGTNYIFVFGLSAVISTKSVNFANTWQNFSARSTKNSAAGEKLRPLIKYTHRAYTLLGFPKIHNAK